MKFKGLLFVVIGNHAWLCKKILFQRLCIRVENPVFTNSMSRILTGD